MSEPLYGGPGSECNLDIFKVGVPVDLVLTRNVRSAARAIAARARMLDGTTATGYNRT